MSDDVWDEFTPADCWGCEERDSELVKMRARVAELEAALKRYGHCETSYCDLWFGDGPECEANAYEDLCTCGYKAALKGAR